MDNKLLEEATLIAIESLKNICDKLGLSFEELDNIHDIDIKIGKGIDGDKLAYYPATNLIIVDINHYEELCSKEDRENAVFNLSKGLVHEMLHANRVKVPNKRDGYEEIMCEVVADIITRNYIKDELDVESMAKSIANSSKYELAYRVGAKLVQRLGNNILIRFLHDDKFNMEDSLKDKLGEKYDKLMDALDEMYLAIEEESVVSIFTRMETKDIIDGIKR